MIDKKETPRDFRRKIKRAEESLELWKEKHQDSQYNLKKARAIINALKKGREKQKEIYQGTSIEIDELKKNLEVLKIENKALQEDLKNQKNLENQKKNSY